MSAAWSTLLWAPTRAHDALLALARVRHLAMATPSESTHGSIETRAAALGLEAEPVEACYDDIELLLSRAESMLINLSVADTSGWLLLIKGGARRLLLLTPQLEQQRIPTSLLRDALCAPLEALITPTLTQLLSAVPSTRQARVRRALLRTNLAKAAIPVGWLLRAAPAANFFAQLRSAGLWRRTGWLIGAHALAYGLGICAWSLLGAAALSGRYDPGWWLAWVLMTITLGGLRALSGWWQVQLLTSAAVLLKRRLLYGTLRLRHDDVKREGAGQLLGRVLEAEAIEHLGLNGGLTAALTCLEIIMCMALLPYGAGGVLHVALLLIWLVLGGFIGWRYVSLRRAWTGARLMLTHHLTEQMLGHRTRLVQQPVAQWHDGEDAALANYNDQCRQMDRWSVALTVLVPRGWLIVSLGTLAFALLAGTSLYAMAIGVGACLLAYSALQKLTNGALQLATAVIAWDQVAAMFKAGRQPTRPPLLSIAANGRSDTVLSAQNIVFSHRGQRVLQGLDLQVRRGERILLEGASGSGKSTLANIIGGLRQPESGLLLLNGLDAPTLGDSWRRHSVNVPQFHENHLLSESLAFNLLMSRDWPPQPEDLQAAEALCCELGLGDLLQRMPGGLWQSVGENGWRLSHGERSRVYLARALLHPASLVIFDESFAALDPENLAGAIDCVLARAPSLIVIAHP